MHIHQAVYEHISNSTSGTSTVLADAADVIASRASPVILFAAFTVVGSAAVTFIASAASAVAIVAAGPVCWYQPDHYHPSSLQMVAITNEN